MIPLYAYDFDKTLIPYDSFRRYLLHLLPLRPIRIGGLLVMRKMGFISSSRMKAYITKIVNTSPSLQRDAKHFAHSIVYDVQIPAIASKDAKVLLISASPSVYMKYIAEDLSYDLLCSDMNGEHYNELYGEAKALALHTYYPTSEYEYVYAESDNEIDLCWMRDFNEYRII